MNNKEISSYIETFSTILIALTLFLLPLFFLTNTTDFFVVPKQILIIITTVALIVVFCIKIILERKIVFTTSPLNLPVALFGAVILISSILSQNRYDALIQAVPALAAIFFFFAIINNVREKNSFSIVLTSLLLGAAASALLSIAYNFKIYVLPIPSIQSELFNTFGSNLQQLIFLIPVLVFSLLYLGKTLGFPKLAASASRGAAFFIQLIAGIAILGGVLLIIYQIVTSPNKPVILPYIYGFQTAFATISQDAQRFIFSLLFGSGYGTFLVDFTRYKLPSFNLEPNLWNLTFSYSSSYVLELIATTGILGGIAFIFMLFSTFKMRASKNALFTSVFAGFILAFILPFSYANVVLLFVLLALYISYLNIEGDKNVYDVLLSLVASKSGMFAFEATPESQPGRKSESAALSIISSLVLLAIVGTASFFTYKFIVSDTAFAASLSQANLNNGQKTYQLQASAINDFPYRSDYHRIFSQVNMALANSIASGIPQGSSPSAQVQQNISTLLQQGITSGRNAAVVSPLTSVNWQNLGQTYRSLINVGQNAEQFSISSYNQAIALDPYNPNLYLQLGGIYYQLKLWDQAQGQFQIAINLKRDFANAYYNLGKALEQKGDLENALAAYNIVKQLSEKNKENLDQINKDIAAIEAQIGSKKTETGENIQPQGGQQTPLTVNEQPPAALPTQNPPLKISPPPGTTPPASESAN